MTDTNHVVLLTSGGADSLAATILLTKAGYKLTYLFIDYGQPALEAEVAMVSTIAKNKEFYGDVVVKCIDMSTNFNKESLGSQEILLRNFVFMSVASQVAMSIGVGAIATGYVDMVNATYFIDDNPKMLQDYGKLIGDNFGLRLLLPTAGLDKEMVYSLIFDNDTYNPYELPVCNISADASICHTCEKCKTAERIIDDVQSILYGEDVES